MSAVMDSHPSESDTLRSDIPSFRKPATAAENIQAARRKRLFLRLIPLSLLAWVMAFGTIAHQQSSTLASHDQVLVNKLLSEGEMTIQRKGELYTVNSATYEQAKREMGADIKLFNRALVASSEHDDFPPDFQELITEKARAIAAHAESAEQESKDQAVVDALLSEGEITVQVNGRLYPIGEERYDKLKQASGEDVNALNKALIASSEHKDLPPDFDRLLMEDEPADTPTLLMSFVVLYLLLSPLLLWRQPLRILLLRPFNDRKVSRSIRKFASKNLRGWGHIVTLSDRYINESFLKNSTIYALSPKRYIGSALAIPVLPLVRLPPLIVTVRKEQHVRRVFNALRNRYNLNFYSFFDIIRKVRSTDGLWQRVVLFLVANSDVIIVDLTAKKDGTLWEVEQLARRRLLDRCVFVAEESSDAGIEAALAVLGTTAPKVHRYRKNGGMLEPGEFEAAIARIVSVPG